MTHILNLKLSITGLLISLANVNKLRHIHDDQYEDASGKRLTMTELGFVSTEALNFKLKYDELIGDMEELQADIKILRGERTTLIKQNKEISNKTHLKLSAILKGSMSDKEKVIEAIKYLNI
jgi:hypothetical protein